MHVTLKYTLCVNIKVYLALIINVFLNMKTFLVLLVFLAITIATSEADSLKGDTGYRLKFDESMSPKEVFDKIDIHDGNGLNFTAHIKFEEGDYTLEENSKKLLNMIGSVLVDVEQLVRDELDKSIFISIRAHTDSRGSDSDNLRLSRDRARTVANYLKNHFRLSLAKMETIGLGERQPKYSNKDAWGRAQNRRVEIVMTVKNVIEFSM